MLNVPMKTQIFTTLAVIMVGNWFIINEAHIVTLTKLEK